MLGSVGLTVAAPDQMYLRPVLDAAPQMLVPGLQTEMRQVDRRHRIGRQHLQHLAGRHSFQNLPGPQDGQGTEKAPRVHLPIGRHGAPGMSNPGAASSNPSNRKPGETVQPTSVHSPVLRAACHQFSGTIT